MGGGDLNMKKSWHPVLLVNQERVWKAEKAANEDKKALAQLRKEREEERQLQELQALQEAATGKKRVDKLDWMYAAPGNEGGALGGHRMGDKEMEDYLLGKKRVDDVLAQGDKNIGNTHKEFIAVQNANTVRDTAAKIREDPLLAIKRQELAQMEALKNRPEIRKKLMEAQNRGKESKEDRKAKKREEKEERRRERQETRDRRARRDRSDRSPRSDYSSDDNRRRRSFRSDDRDRRDRRDRDRDDRRSSHRDRSRSRSGSPRRRDRDEDRDRSKRRDESPRRHRDDDRRSDRDERDERSDSRIPPPRQYPSSGPSDSSRHYGSDRPLHPSNNGYGRDQPNRSGPSNGHSNGYANGNSSNGGYRNGGGYSNGNGHSSGPAPVDPAKLAEERAAKLAAMTASASALDASRTQSLAQRAEQEKKEAEREEFMRKKYTKDDVKGAFFSQKAEMGLSETIGRRNGVGLQRDI